MKKIFIMFAIIIPIILSSSPLNESFTNPIFPPIGWRVINNDGGTQSWSRIDTQYYSGPACASSRYEGSTLRNDDWLITSRLTCSAMTPDTLAFRYRKSGGGNPESLEVRLSITGNNVGDFTVVLWADKFTSTTYSQQKISLDIYDGQEIFIAFVNKGLYGFRTNLDDIAGPEMIEIRDVGVDSIVNPASSFIIRPVGIGFSPQAKVKNYSNAIQRNIPVVCSIVGQAYAFRYENIKYIDSLLVDSSKIITFDLFVPTIAEICTVKIRTFLANDTNPINNFKSRTTEIIRGNYTGGPGANYAYWIDSDTTGGPVYNWVDITATGSPLPTGDIIVSGPISIGFDFNYNGEAQNNFYYSTNGFICFDYTSLSYNTNQSIPNSTTPNNILAPFWDDLYTLSAYHQGFGSSPNRYKIIQWHAGVFDVQNIRDTVKFQLILYENGDIVFQYNYCGNRYNLGQGQSATVGIENSAGTSGLQYLYNGTPAGNLLNPGRAIKFFRNCHDVMLDAILTSQVGISDTVFPQTIVKNIGTYNESFSTVFTIQDNAQNLVYCDTVENNNIPAMSVCTLNFREWLPVQFGTYPAKAWTTMVNDINQANDTCSQNILVSLAAPNLISPTNNYITNNRNVFFEWSDVAYATQYNIIITDIVDTVLSTSQCGPKILPEGNYGWQVRAGNGTSWGIWSTTYNFTVDTTRPGILTLVSPASNCTLATPRPEFIWNRNTDAFNYQIQVFTATNTFIDQTIPDTAFAPNQSLPNGFYFWKVRCQDLATNWSDWSETRIFYLQYQVWYQRTDLPELNSNKPVSAGGCITSAGNKIYTLKGNNTQDFYEYDINTNLWTQKCSLPFFTRTDSSVIRKKVKSGASIVNCESLIFAIKGNNTNEFWAYNINNNAWTSKKPVPAIRKIKDGSCLAHYNGNVYCLVGKSAEFEFYKYDIQYDSWVRLRNAPAGRKDKRFRSGSAIILGGNDMLYATKGGSSYNEFHQYCIAQDSWSELETIPNYHPLIRKRNRIRCGGALAYDNNNSVFLVKGGGRNEFWKYNITTGQWLPLETIPRANKKSVPKAGAGLCYTNNQVWLVKGNKTREFWTYLANQKEYSVCCFPVLNNTEQAELVGNHAQINNNQKRFIGKVVIRAGNQKPIIAYSSLSDLTNLSVKVYNLSGQLVSAGRYSDNLFSSLQSGIFLLVLDKW